MAAAGGSHTARVLPAEEMYSAGRTLAGPSAGGSGHSNCGRDVLGENNHSAVLEDRSEEVFVWLEGQLSWSQGTL